MGKENEKKNGKDMTTLPLPKPLIQQITDFFKSVIQSKVAVTLYFACLGLAVCASLAFQASNQEVIPAIGIILVLAAIVCSITATLLAYKETPNIITQ